jgi:hypothetical protein
VSCEQCKDLSVEYRIASPSDLRQAIRVAWDNVTDGTIRQVQTPSGTYGSIDFKDVATGGTWDDLVSYHFQCIHCGQSFHLSAETYHGSGGAWRPTVATAL